MPLLAMPLVADSHITTFDTFAQMLAAVFAALLERIVVDSDVVKIASLYEHDAVSQKDGVKLQVPKLAVAVVVFLALKRVCDGVHDHALEFDSALLLCQILDESL